MSREKTTDQAIEGLVEIEEALSEIYQLFAERFPANQDLWSGMAREETAHAEWVRDLYRRVEEGSLALSKDRFRVEGIQLFLDYVKDKFEEAKEEKLPFLHALDIALDLESSLLERRFYEIFETDPESSEQPLLDMEQQIQAHRERLREALDHEKGLP